MFGSIKNAGKSKPSPPPMAPPAFAPRQNAYGPPPGRTETAAATLPAQEESEEEPEEEAQGEWAEVLYDYDSTVLGIPSYCDRNLPHLPISRILVISKSGRTKMFGSQNELRMTGAFLCPPSAQVY